MDAVDFLKQFNRMCKTYIYDGCTECPAYKYRCGDQFDGQEEDGVSIVEQWAKEHPIKTRQSELKKLFPDLTLEDGWFCMCPKYVGQKECIDGPFEKSTCDKCRRDFWLKEIE